MINYYQILFWNAEKRKYLPLHPDLDFSRISSIPCIVNQFGLNVLRKNLKTTKTKFISVPFNCNSYGKQCN